MQEEPLRTPWDQAKSQRRRSRDQEKRNGKLPGGREQINSGRIRSKSKRDNQLGGFLVESRTTSKGSYSIEREEFLQIERDAFGTPPSQLPAMQIDFEPTHTSLRTLSLFVTRLEDHLDLVAQLALSQERVSELERELRGTDVD